MSGEATIALVSGGELCPGDRIVLDSGDEVMVRDVTPGTHMDQCVVSLKGRPPLRVNGYDRKIFRKIVGKESR